MTRRGFTMIEAALSLVIVSAMLIAALNTVGTSQMMQYKMTSQSRALLLAEDLMTEILQLPYEEPVQMPIEMGLEAGESGGDRLRYDDVDDYHGWRMSPPRAPDGTPVPETAGYRRIVKVQWVEPDDVVTSSATETGLKRVEVTVEFEGNHVVTLCGLRSEGVPDPVQTQDVFGTDGK